MIALVGLALVLAVALGLRAWRRYRGGIALPKTG